MNTMKEVKIIQSSTEPNKNHLWLSDEGLKQFKGNGWEQVLSNGNGGNGGSGDGSTDPNDENYVEYLDISGYEKDGNRNLGSILEVASIYNCYYKTIDSGLLCIYSSTLSIANGAEIAATRLENAQAICLMPNAKMTVTKGEEPQSFYELLKSLQSDEFYNSIPRITKEQFYNLNE